jgi:hypothetical protein
MRALVFLVPNSNEDSPIEMADRRFENYSSVALLMGIMKSKAFPSGAARVHKKHSLAAFCRASFIPSDLNSTFTGLG